MPAVVTTAEGEKSSAILRAEGQKQALIVNAEDRSRRRFWPPKVRPTVRLRAAQAEAQAIQVVAEVIGGAGNPRSTIAQRYSNRQRHAAGAQKLVFMPYEASGVMASLGGIRELLRAEPAK